MNLLDKVSRRTRLWRDRWTYEVRRPRLSADHIGARLSSGAAGVDVTAPGGYKKLLERHFEVTPQAPVWDDDGAEPPGDERDVNWHTDPQFGVEWPRQYVAAISDMMPGTDLTLLWHKNQMFPLLDLARRYELSGERHWAERWYQLVDSWCVQNPFMVGKNWRSPMETGTRLVVWSQSLSMLRSAGPPDDDVCARLIESVVRQADYVASHFTEVEHPNNHLIGEAATLYAFAAYWPLFGDASGWMESARHVLEREVQRQVLADGFDYEGSVNYHLYVIDFLLVYLHAAALVAESPPRVILDAVARMIDAALALVSPSGRFPQIGDDSVVDFFALRRLHPALATARPGEAVAARDLVRPAIATLLSSRDWGAALVSREAPPETARYFEDAGIAVVRRKDSHVTLVAGPQHDRPFSSGHLNLDAGSLELEVDGRAVFVDSGTYLYRYDIDVRRHFRGASAHNTVTVDGRDPVRNERVFGWSEVHVARVLAWRDFDGGVLAACEREVPGARGARFVHRRCLVEVLGIWVVVDEVSGDGATVETRHEAEALWHTPLPSDAVTLAGDHRVALAGGGGPEAVVMEVFSSGGHEVSVLDDVDDLRTWYSRWYGDLQRGATVRTALPVGDGCRMAHVIRRAGVSVRFDGWRHGGPVLAVTPPGGTARVVEVALDGPALSLDGSVVA